MLAPALFLLTVGAAAIPAFSSAAGAAAPPDACDLAQANFDARRLEQAFAAYSGAARQCPDRDANVRELNVQREARDGALHDAAVAVEAAGAKGVDAATKAANIERARLAYVKALKADSASTAAKEGLAALDVSAPETDSYKNARALYEEKLFTEAKAEVIKQLGAGHKLPSGNEGDQFRKLLDEDYGKSGWEKFTGWVDARLEEAGWVLGLLIVLGIVCVAILAFLNVTWFDARRRSGPPDGSPGPDESGPAAVTTPARPFFRPRLNVVAGEGDAAKELTARVRNAIAKLDDSDGARQIRFATVPEEQLDLSQLGDIDARVKPLLAALKLLSHRDTVTFSLSTGTDDSAHTRVSIEAFAPKTARRSESFVRPAKGGALTPGLVGSATSWTLFFAEEMRARLRSGPARRVAYGTESARSYGAYIGALECLQSGNLDATRALLIESVQADPEFHRAALNLAVVETMDKDALVRGIGIQRLRSLLS